MPAIEPFSPLFGINHNLLSKEENIILEIELFTQVCNMLMEYFGNRQKNYFKLIKLTKEMENHMIEEKLMFYVLNDILSTGEYSLEGIASYTKIPEEVLLDVAIGRNYYLSLMFSRKIIELHRNVRTDLYQTIVKKAIIIERNTFLQNDNPN